MASNAEQKPESKTRNYVAKYARTYNRAQCHVNKKVAFKKGKIKHKAKGFDLINLFAQIY